MATAAAITREEISVFMVFSDLKGFVFPVALASGDTIVKERPRLKKQNLPEVLKRRQTPENDLLSHFQSVIM